MCCSAKYEYLMESFGILAVDATATFLLIPIDG